MASVVSFVVLLFITSSISLVSGGSNENVNKTCIGTPFPETCISTLSWFPESKDADARGMVGLMVWATMPTINKAASIASGQMINHEDLSDEETVCYTGCSNEMHKAYEILDAAYGRAGKNISQVKLPELCKFLHEANEKHVEWNCDRCRKGEAKTIVDDISKDNEAEKRMAVLSVLLDRVTE